MDSPTTARPAEDPRELTTAMVALQCRTTPVPLDAAAKVTAASQSAASKSRSNRRALLALGLFVLLLAGILQLATTTPVTRSGPSDGSRANVVFSNALSGTCLAWPPDSPDKPSFVQCTENHMFEVARPVGMENFMEPCQLAVRDYLGQHFDPNSKFTSTVLWAGDEQDSKTDERNMLCGLQLPGPDGRPFPFKGAVAEQDQSKVWPAGTCLGIDPQSAHSTERPVPCAAPHAVEVTGTVNVGESFTNGRPAEPEQDGFLRDACTRATDGYLAPVPLTVSGLAVNYPLVSAQSWTAGSRQVSCTIGIKRDDDKWVSLVGSAKDGVLLEGQAPPPPPELVTPTPTEPPPAVVEETTTTAAPSTSATPTTTAATPTTTSATPTTTSPATTAVSPSASTSASASVAPPSGPPPGPPPGQEPTPTTTQLPSNMIDTPFGPVVLPWLPVPEPTG